MNLALRTFALTVVLGFAAASCKSSANTKEGTASQPPVAKVDKCDEGYDLKDGTCVDIDECGGVATPCGPHPDAKCTNKPGAYECTCAEGFVGGGPGGFGCFPALVGLYDANASICMMHKERNPSCWAPNGGKPAPTKVPQLEALSGVVTVVPRGRGSHCALVRDGSVHCWGANDKGQLGIDASPRKEVPVRVPGIADAVDLVASSTVACVLRRHGTVACWGEHRLGSPGRDAPSNIGLVADVPALRGAVSLSQHLSRTCALLGDGTARCWGSSAPPQSDSTDSTAPRALHGVEKAIQLAMGGHECFLRSDRTVWCSGDNAFGQLGTGDQITSHAPRQAKIDDASWLGASSERTWAIRRGEVYKWGRDLNRQGEGGEGYDAVKHESTPGPTRLEGVSGVRSLDTASSSLAVLDHGRIAVVNTGISYVIDAAARD